MGTLSAVHRSCRRPARHARTRSPNDTVNGLRNYTAPLDSNGEGREAAMGMVLSARARVAPYCSAAS